MADNPISWLILTIVCLYLIGRFLWRVIQENEHIKAEREKICNEIFLENSIDKRNIACYNRYINNSDKVSKTSVKKF